MQAQVISFKTRQDITCLVPIGRSTSEIWDELRQCGMVSVEDFEKRKRLITELQRGR